MVEITQKQIDAWKKEHGEIFKLNYFDEVIYVKGPDRKTVSYASASANGDILKYNEVILENSWVHGNKDLIKKPGFLLSMSANIGNMVGIAEVEMVKL